MKNKENVKNNDLHGRSEVLDLGTKLRNERLVVEDEDQGCQILEPGG